MEPTNQRYYSTKELSLITKKVRRYSSLGRYHRAIKLLTRCLRNSVHPQFFLERSQCYVFQGKYQNSLKDAKSALNLLPRSGECFYAVALAYYKLKNLKVARDFIMKGLMTDPQSVVLRQFRRIVYSESIELTEEQIIELREAFYLFDEDLNGFIEKPELYEVMRRLGTDDITEKEVIRILSYFDLNADNNIEFSEFVSLMADELKNSSVRKELKMAFSFFDTDGGGTVSLTELKEGLMLLGEESIAKNVTLMFKDLKLKKEIDFEDFISAMVCNKFNS